MGSEAKVLTVRIPTDMHDRLLAYKYFTGRSINDVAVHLLGQFLDGPGSDEMVAAMGRRTADEYSLAMEKLAH